MVDEKQVSEIVKNVIAGMDISSFDNLSLPKMTAWVCD